MDTRHPTEMPPPGFPEALLDPSLGVEPIAAAAISSPAPAGAGVSEQGSLTLDGVSRETYVAVNDAFPDRRPVRMMYCDRRLTFVPTSRKHDRYAARLGDLVQAVVFGCGIEWECAGSATFRREDSKVGVEGDRTYYFGEHATVMLVPVDIDHSKQPPPDLAIEVEVTPSAGEAMKVWGRLGVPELWRFDPIAWTFGFWIFGEEGVSIESDRSPCLPKLTAADVLEQLRLADEIGSSRWFAQLPG